MFFFNMGPLRGALGLRLDASGVAGGGKTLRGLRPLRPGDKESGGPHIEFAETQAKLGKNVYPTSPMYPTSTFGIRKRP